MRATVHIRAATPADAGAIAAVHIRSWQAAYARILPDAYLKGLSVPARTATWAKALQTGESAVLVAATDDQTVGFVSFGPCRDTGAPEGRSEVWALYAVPELWGLGAGWRLLHSALSQLAAHGYSDTTLWVLAANANAIRFYERQGFVVVAGSAQRFTLGGVEVEELQFIKPA